MNRWADLLLMSALACAACGEKSAPPPPEAQPAAIVSPKPAPPVQSVAPPASPKPAPPPKREAAAPHSPALGRIGDPFIDRFAALDDARWTISDGWSNADWMTSIFRREAVAIAPDGLALTAARETQDAAKPYAAGEIRARGTFRYGYFEGRLKMPKGPGLVAGLFAYAPAGDGAFVQEIDIEILGRDTRQVELTLHMGSPAGLQTNTEIVRLPFDAADGFHTYAFDWRPEAIRFYVDGRLRRTVKKAAFAPPDRPLSLYVDIWPTERLVKWAGGAPQGPGPWPLTLSCVAYQASYKGKPVC